MFAFFGAAFDQRGVKSGATCLSTELEIEGKRMPVDPLS